MKRIIIISVGASVLSFIFTCRSRVSGNMKDMSENMMDIKIYQENLGDEIMAKNWETASWLADGLDSILHVVADKFAEHRRLRRSFSYYYRKYLYTPMSNIRSAVNDRDTFNAVKHYGILVKKCDGCHIDNDIDEEVRY